MTEIRKLCLACTELWLWTPAHEYAHVLEYACTCTHRYRDTCTDTHTHTQTHRDIKNDLVVKTVQALWKICDCYLLIISQATTTSYIRPCVPVGLTTAGSTTKHTAYTRSSRWLLLPSSTIHFPRWTNGTRLPIWKVSIDDSVDWEGACQPEKSHSWRAVRDEQFLSDVEHVCPALSRLGLALGHFPVVKITEFLCQFPWVGFCSLKPEGSDEYGGTCSNTRFFWQFFKGVKLHSLL